MKRNGNGDGNGVPVDAPRARARYLTGKAPANDACDGNGGVVLTAEQLVALVRRAVDLALDERDARAGRGAS